MSFKITYSVPVSRHIFKYLVRKEGTDHIEASRKTLVGSLVLSMLSPNDFPKVYLHENRRAFKIDISDEFIKDNCGYISPKILYSFDYIIEKVFREEMFSYCFIAKIANEADFSKSIEAFCNYYYISDDDLNLDSLYRDFKRKKHERSLENNPQLKLLFE